MAAALAQECQICTSVKKTVFQCPYCAYTSCLSCNERVILDSTQAPACAKCKHEYTSDFFYSTFSKAFTLKRYKEHREKVLFEREKSLMPATQPAADRERRRLALNDQLLQARRVWNEARIAVKNARRHVRLLEMQTNLMTEEQGDEKQDLPGRVAYIGHCPKTDCRGFLTADHECGMCHTRVCARCHEISASDTHTCNPDTVATVEELAKTTRNCPNCHATIFKISGCDQMWCVMCNVAFSWETGQIERGIIHNPHYYEYLRQNGGVPRNPHEERDGGMPPARFLAAIRGTMLPASPNQAPNSCARYISNIYRFINHLRQVVIRVLPTPIDNVTHQDLRIDFLLQRMDEAEFKVRLQRRERDRLKKLEQRTLLETYCNVGQILLQNMYEMGRVIANTGEYEWSEQSAGEFIEQEAQIREYTREAYRKMNEKFGSSIHCPV